MGSKTYCVIMFFVTICVIYDIGFCRELPEVNPLGGERDLPLNGGEMENIGRFSVQQYNQNQNTLLEFVRVVSAKEQTVSGTIYHLTLEAVDGGKSKKYEAKVWVKPWNNFKQLQEFKPATE